MLLEQNFTNKFICYLSDIYNRDFKEIDYYEAKLCLMDFLAVCSAGAYYNRDNISSLLKKNESEDGKYKIIGSKHTTDIYNSVILNAFHSHLLELDDGQRKGMLHLGTTIIPPLLAIAKKNNLSGVELLKGIIIGYEAAIILSELMQPYHRNIGYHTTATIGTIAASVAVAYSLKYNHHQLKATLSCAATSSSGLLEMQEDSSELKAYNSSNASISALHAVEFGFLGIKAPDDILLGERGFIKVLTSHSVNEPNIIKSEQLRIHSIYRKRYASCRHTHSSVDALTQLIEENNIYPPDISSINVFIYKQAINGHVHKDILGSTSAKMSIPMTLAISAYHPNLSIKDFSKEVISDNQINKLKQRIEIYEDPFYTKNAHLNRSSRVEINIGDNKYIKEIINAKGEPENKFSYDDFLKKIKELFVYANYDETYITEIVEYIMSLERKMNIQEFKY